MYICELISGFSIFWNDVKLSLDVGEGVESQVPPIAVMRRLLLEKYKSK